MNKIEFISVPKSWDFPSNWMETPIRDDRVDHVATSIFSKWTYSQMSKASLALKAVSVLLIGALGYFAYRVHILGILFSAGLLTLSLVGQSTIRREILIRTKEICLLLEDWLIKFKDACGNIKTSILLFPLDSILVPPEAVDVNELLDLHTDVVKQLVSALEEVPENQLNVYADLLKENHQRIFGRFRKTEKGYWSFRWIEHQLKQSYGQKLDDFYSTIMKLKLFGKDDLESANLEHKKNMFAQIMVLLKELVERDEIIARDIIPADPNEMFLLTNRLGASPQGQEAFPTIIDQTEYWRRNIAIFRSSI